MPSAAAQARRQHYAGCVSGGAGRIRADAAGGEPASTSMDRLIEQLPDLLDKAEHLLKQKRLAKEEGIE